jgi:hypothetical protein
MYVAMKMSRGDITVQVLGSEIASRDWLPDGCVGVLFVFDSLEAIRKFYGPDVPTVEIAKT